MKATRFVQISTNGKDGSIWVVAKDVAETLGYKWHHMLLDKIPEEWKRGKRFTTVRGDKELSVLSEQGLYFFLARSDKPKALPFQKWIAGEVLPTLRKTGNYSLKPKPQNLPSATTVIKLQKHFEELARISRKSIIVTC